MNHSLPIDLQVVGVRKQAMSEQWQAMRDVYDACRKANIDVPSAVTDYFGGLPPRPNCVTEVDIQSAVTEHVLDHQTRDVQWFEVCLEELPESVTHLRFVVERTD